MGSSTSSSVRAWLLRKGNSDKGSGLTAAGNEQDQSFMVAEISGTRCGSTRVSHRQVFDSGVITRRK
jgi:hypothetical protein